MRKIGLSVTVTASCYMISILFYYFLRGWKEKWSLCFWWRCLPTLNSWHCYAIHKASMCKASLPVDAHALQQWGAQHTPVIDYTTLCTFPPYVLLSLKWENQLLKLQKRKIKHCKYTNTCKPVLKYSSFISFIHSFIISCPMHGQCVAQS